jgi:hypothetical protein
VDERDRLEQATASVLAEPVPATLTVTTVQRRAQRIRRRQQVIAGVAAALVVLVIGTLAVTARRGQAVSVVVNQPAPIERHTNRYRFTREAPEADRRATIDRIRARYQALGSEVTTEVLSDTEFTVTDTFGREQSDRFARALTIVGATSLRAVLQREDEGGDQAPSPASVPPGASTTTVGTATASPLERCDAPALSQYRPSTRELVSCSTVGAELAVDPGDGALTVEEVVRASADGGSIGLRVTPALTPALVALQDACAQRAPNCPTGSIALTLDDTVAGTSWDQGPAVPAGPGTIGIEGLFDQQLGEWLRATVHTGRLLVAVERVPAPSDPATTTAPAEAGEPDDTAVPTTPAPRAAVTTTAPARPPTTRSGVGPTTSGPPPAPTTTTTAMAPAPSTTTTLAPSTTTTAPSTTTTPSTQP